MCIGRKWGRVLFFLWGQSFWDVPTCPFLRDDPQLCTSNNFVRHLETGSRSPSAHTLHCHLQWDDLRHTSWDNIMHPSPLYKLPWPWGPKILSSQLALSPNSVDGHHCLIHALLPPCKRYTNSIFCQHLLSDVRTLNPATVLNSLIQSNFIEGYTLISWLEILEF